MKSLLSLVISLAIGSVTWANSSTSIELTPPRLEGGKPLMEALSLRSSVRAFDSRQLELADLSDLMWAAFGVNRPEEGKRTAASAYNAQDLELYVFLQEGVYFYEATEHVLHQVEPGDHRNLLSRGRDAYKDAPLFIVLVSDVSKFPQGSEEKRKEWGAISAGLVSQNISLFCASAGLITRPRAGMDSEGIRDLLFLQDNQLLLINHTVSYPIPE